MLILTQSYEQQNKQGGFDIACVPIDTWDRSHGEEH